jgi:GDP-D-mannose dehydratase
LRQLDVPLVYGDCIKTREYVGYQPERRLEDTLQKILDY